MKHTKRILCTILTLALIVCLCAVPVSAADEAWKGAYRTVIEQNTDESGCICQLVDFNMDGTPELIIGGAHGSGLFSVIQHAFTLRDGAAVEVSVGDEYLKLANSYELYRNDTTGEIRVEGKYVVRGGAGVSSDVTANYTFNGTVFNYVTAFVSSVDLGKNTYTVGTETVIASQYNSAYNARNVGWTKILFSAPSLTSTKKPTSAEIDSLLSSYENGSVFAAPSSHGLTVNGKAVSAAAYTIGGSNYFKLRDLAMLLTDTGSKFEVSYDTTTNSISITTGQDYTPQGVELNAGNAVGQLGTETASAIYIDGESVSLTGYNVNGNNYFKLRDLGDALGFDVGWNDATRTVSITAANNTPTA